MANNIMNSAGRHPDAGAHLPGPAPNTAGPHNKDLLNKIDPTVDSMSGGTQVLGPGVNQTSGSAPIRQDNLHSRQDNLHTGNRHTAPGSAATTGFGTGHHHNNTHMNTATAGAAGGAGLAGRHHNAPGEAGYGSTARAPAQTYQGEMGSNNYQPQHSSHMANALDPRVDTKNTHTTGGAGYENSSYAPTANQYPVENTREGMYEPHSTRLGNAADPRIDSSRGTHGRENIVGGHSTTVHQGPAIHPGPATKTAGPHKSNLLNKLDPTVDSKETITRQSEYRTS